MKRYCSNCKRVNEVADKDIETAEHKENYPFIGITQVFQIRYYQCPVCMKLCEIERQLIRVLKDGKPVPLDTPV